MLQGKPDHKDDFDKTHGHECPRLGNHSRNSGHGQHRNDFQRESDRDGSGIRQYPPDYDVTAEEFDRLRQDGTAESMSMFLARNPDHPLAVKALALLRSGRLSKGASSRPTPDSEVYRGFAAAVAANTATAYDSFAARYGTHPLAALARRLKQRI
ncbi:MULTISPECIES: hypothetical protein [unclassified Mesorhizobium]|uniref:hypothetical protein n=1 Tax=unclassified Mesorhizobium TaxID=325217 RepID=UPI001129AA92|nr:MULTISPECIES: hypothetical protein [unclassified Mesorhizobium]MBZ9702497.1 hypothetical protein [Mesorhizobium sp. CO1-1-3]MBZ9948787.1 hypothetical protein [Mesorhizobium sp. BR1-1-11]TPJ09595.1 hypothetical protein FJ428_02900 [Mesorhizobium sp. B2-8-1]